jgi:hypothetical protein
MTDHEIAEKARKINSIEWIILESGIMELDNPHGIRDELLAKFVALRDVVLSESKVCPYGKVSKDMAGTTEYCKNICPATIKSPCDWRFEY